MFLILFRSQGNQESFEEYSKKALNLLTGDAYAAALTEYFKYLLSAKGYERIWSWYQERPNGMEWNII